MPRRRPARLLAPLSLLAALVAVAAIVSSGGTDGSPSSSTSTSTTRTGTTRTGTTPRTGTSTTRTSTTRTSTTSTTPTTGARTYTVEAGDSLSAIADKTGVPLERLQELNPDLDPAALQTGQSIRLAPSP